MVLFAFITSWNEFIAALIFMNKETAVHRADPAWSACARAFRRGRLGRAAGGIIIAIIPCVLVYVLLQKYYVSGFLRGAVK